MWNFKYQALAHLKLLEALVSRLCIGRTRKWGFADVEERIEF